jgi:hypothetical protein
MNGFEVDMLARVLTVVTVLKNEQSPSHIVDIALETLRRIFTMLNQRSRSDLIYDVEMKHGLINLIQARMDISEWTKFESLLRFNRDSRVALRILNHLDVEVVSKIKRFMLDPPKVRTCLAALHFFCMIHNDEGFQTKWSFLNKHQIIDCVIPIIESSSHDKDVRSSATFVIGNIAKRADIHIHLHLLNHQEGLIPGIMAKNYHDEIGCRFFWQYVSFSYGISEAIAKIMNDLKIEKMAKVFLQNDPDDICSIIILSNLSIYEEEKDEEEEKVEGEESRISDNSITRLSECSIIEIKRIANELFSNQSKTSVTLKEVNVNRDKEAINVMKRDIGYILTPLDMICRGKNNTKNKKSLVANTDGRQFQHNLIFLLELPALRGAERLTVIRVIHNLSPFFAPFLSDVEHTNQKELVAEIETAYSNFDFFQLLNHVSGFKVPRSIVKLIGMYMLLLNK